MGTNILQRLKHTAPYWWAPERMVYYVGCVGLGNLGDELMLPLYQQLFSGWRLAHHRPVGPFPIQRALESTSRRLAMLGGGTMIAGGRDSVRHERFEWAVNRLGAGVVFGSGVMYAGPPPLKEQFWAEIPQWRGLLDRCRYIGVRGPFSVAALAETGVSAEQLGDPVCQLVRPTAPAASRPAIGVNVGLIHDQWRSDTDVVLDATAEVIRWARGRDLGVEFFVVRAGDEEPTRLLADRAGVTDPTVHSIYYDAEAYLSAVAGLPLFVGLKLHAAALALCAGTPTIAIAYEPKGHDFMHSVHAGHWSMDIADITADSLVERAEALLPRGADEASAAMRAMRELRAFQQRRAREVVDALFDAGDWPVVVPSPPTAAV